MTKKIIKAFRGKSVSITKIAKLKISVKTVVKTVSNLIKFQNEMVYVYFLQKKAFKNEKVNFVTQWFILFIWIKMYKT